jgi:hypothetical protein
VELLSLPCGLCVLCDLLPSEWESRDSEKMKNRGNEAKKWLRAKDITFFKGANHVRFARSFAQI